MLIDNWEKALKSHDKYAIVKIKGEYICGKIQIKENEDGKDCVYLLNDKQNGGHEHVDKKGYKFCWCLGDKESFEFTSKTYITSNSGIIDISDYTVGQLREIKYQAGYIQHDDSKIADGAIKNGGRTVYFLCNDIYYEGGGIKDNGFSHSWHLCGESDRADKKHNSNFDYLFLKVNKEELDIKMMGKTTSTPMTEQDKKEIEEEFAKNVTKSVTENVRKKIKEEDEGFGMFEKIFMEGVKKNATSFIESEDFKDKVVSRLEEYGIFPRVQEIEVTAPNGEKTKFEGQHEKFQTILQAISGRLNVALVGPAGSGKTTIIHNVADALKLDFYSKSVSAQTSIHEIFGYMDANGKYVESLFRKAYEKGGVFLLDEFDAGNPNVLASMNQATANGSCAFPDGMIVKHKDFVVVMAGNTYGTGATAEYVGRNKIDAATLDRFVFIELPYDKNFELELSTNKEWCEKIQNIREKAEKKGVKIVISPRATFNGEKLLAQGMKEEEVLSCVVYKNLSEAEIQLINQ